MSQVIQALQESTDPLENDVARIFILGQELKRARGEPAILGYEPKGIMALGVEEVIARRVLNASAGFEDVDPEQSYEALVLKYPERFKSDVIAAAQKRLKLGASKASEWARQDIQYFIKTRALELFGEAGVPTASENWIGREVALPKLHRANGFAEERLRTAFLGLVWLHEEKKDGEQGRGLTALVQFGPVQPDRRSCVLDALFFEHPVGKELLKAHENDGTFISKIDASRHSRIWPIGDDDVDLFLSAIRKKVHLIAEYEKESPNPDEPLNLEMVDDTSALRRVVLRRNQTAFRQRLLRERANRCSITGTSELSVLEAAHIIPFAQRFADRDKSENGLILRSDVHKLFDAHLISINPETKLVEVSKAVKSTDYQDLLGTPVSDPVSIKSLEFHFRKFQSQNP